jgi:hypothetical protein
MYAVGAGVSPVNVRSVGMWTRNPVRAKRYSFTGLQEVDRRRINAYLGSSE